MSKELQLYMVNTKYVRNLMNAEKHASKNNRCNTIISNSPQRNKQGRPYVGIIVIANDRQYCIPLCSNDEKAKYENMRENITMRKIRDDNNKVIGILNINNMIPVREEYLEQFDTTIYSSDTEKQVEFKKKCSAELKWCREHISEIERYARNLHDIICSDIPFGKRSICPHYDALEKECDKEKTLPKRSVQKQNKRNQMKSKRKK
jgi:protein AbiQ